MLIKWQKGVWQLLSTELVGLRNSYKTLTRVHELQFNHASYAPQLYKVLRISMVSFVVIFGVHRNAYTLFVMDNVGSTRMADSGMMDLKKLGEMWKSLGEAERDVSNEDLPA